MFYLIHSINLYTKFFTIRSNLINSTSIQQLLKKYCHSKISCFALSSVHCSVILKNLFRWSFRVNLFRICCTRKKYTAKLCVDYTEITNNHNCIWFQLFHSIYKINQFHNVICHFTINTWIIEYDSDFAQFAICLFDVPGNLIALYETQLQSKWFNPMK